MNTQHIVAQARLDSPLGPLTAAATERGLAGLWFDGQAHHPGPLAAPVRPAQTHIEQTRHELELYWRQALPQGFSVALDPAGTAFQQAVWQALGDIAAGHTLHYADIAARLGKPMAARAVGAAIGRNPLSIIVPCHRVLGRGGALTGYAGGLARKRSLLDLEAAATSTTWVTPNPSRPPAGTRSRLAGPVAGRELQQ
jgi:methylated-DNA-[protein]-cysteine S-methyltransferase